MTNSQGVEGVALPAGIAYFRQLFGNTPGTQPLICVEVKDYADDLRFLLVNGQHAVLFVEP